MAKHNVYRDGKVHVCAEMCATCVFRPGNVMHLTAGQLRRLVDEAVAIEGYIPCHKRLVIAGCADGDAICRGFFERHKTQAIQIAERAEIVEFVSFS